jgi:hypothetical protein
MARLRCRRTTMLAAVAGAGLAAKAGAQVGVNDGLLAAKKRFAEQRLAALAPLVGVHTAAGVTPGLFPIRTTGVSTAPNLATPNPVQAPRTPTHTKPPKIAVHHNQWHRRDRQRVPGRAHPDPDHPDDLRRRRQRVAALVECRQRHLHPVRAAT